MNRIVVNTGLALLTAATFTAEAQEIRGRSIHNGAIIAAGSRLCLELAQSYQQDGARLQQGGCRDGGNAWEVKEVGNNEFAIINVSNGRVLDVEGASVQDGANVQQWSWNQSGAQRWRLDTKPNGAYQIVNVASGKCLDVEAHSKLPGGRITQYRCTGAENQLFRFDRAAAQIGDRDGRWPNVAVLPPPVVVAASVAGRPSGRLLYTGMIHSRATDKCVDLERAGIADGTNIRQWSCNASSAQIWDVVDLGRNEIAFVSQASSKVMDVQGGERRSGADVRQYSWTGAPTQRWRMENAERGFSRIVNVGSGKCLDLEAARANDGAEISQVDCHAGLNQQWRIEVSGNDSEWRGYNAGRNWGKQDQAYSEEPPAYLVGDFKGYNNFYQANIVLSIYSDGVVVAVVDGGQRVTGYYRGGQLFLGNARYDVQLENTGFRTTQPGQPASAISYVRARYESPRGR